MKILVKESIIKSRIIKVINGVWCLPLVLIMRSLHKLTLVKLCGIRADRIGHFVSDSAEQFARFSRYGSKTLTLYFLEGKSANLQWELMVRRNLPNLKGKWLGYVAFWNKTLPGGKRHQLKSSLTRSRDLEGLFQKTSVAFPFTSPEDDFGKNWLKSKGWQEGEPFIALLVRDSKYLQVTKPDQSWDYHNYRNSDIQDYLPAIEWLIENRVWVFRMGRHTKEKLEISNNKFVDYSQGGCTSDLLDIWIFANATAIISTSTGIDQLGGLYFRPTLFLNALPLFELASYFNMTWVPKNLIWHKSKEPLNLHQSVEHSYYIDSQYSKNGIEIVNLTQLEILESVKEFWHRLNNIYTDTSSEIERQKQFWKSLKTQPNYHKFHKYIHPEARVGSYWLCAQGDNFLK